MHRDKARSRHAGAGGDASRADISATGEESAHRAPELVFLASDLVAVVASFLDSYSELCTMSAVSTWWCEGVRAARVTVYGRRHPRTVRGDHLGSFRRSFPQAVALGTARASAGTASNTGALRGMVSLQRLTFGSHGAQLTDVALTELVSGPGALTALTALNIVGCSDMSEATAGLVATLPRLKELELSSSSLSDGGCAAIAHAKGGLRVLRVRRAGCCERRAVHGLAGERGSSSPCVCQVGPTSAGIATLMRGLTSLTTLDLFWCSVSGTALSAIASAPALTCLTLTAVRGPDVDPPRLECLAGATGLTRLDLSSSTTWVDNEGMPTLRGMPGLRELVLDSCDRISDVGLKCLDGYLPELQSLGIYYVRIADEATVEGWVRRAQAGVLTRLRVGDVGFEGRRGLWGPRIAQFARDKCGPALVVT